MLFGVEPSVGIVVGGAEVIPLLLGVLALLGGTGAPGCPPVDGTGGCG